VSCDPFKMGERKVLNRYVPPDFDPSIIPKFKREKNRLIEVRMMLPFSLRCNTCGEYMYKGKKFNSKSEYVKGEEYLGIKKLRFYIKCTHCSAEIAFKTDPKNADYECESGASRNYEMWKDNRETVENEKKERLQEEESDAMKALEHRTVDNKMELDVLDALDEIKALNYRHSKVDTNKLLEKLATENKKEKEEEKKEEDFQLSKEDEELLKTIRERKQKQQEQQVQSSVLYSGVADNTTKAGSSAATSAKSDFSSSASAFPLILRKRKLKSNESDELIVSKNRKGQVLSSNQESMHAADSLPNDSLPVNIGALASLVGDYGDDSD
jgi:hypothetical protein